jgi:hypothetical protein
MFGAQSDGYHTRVNERDQRSLRFVLAGLDFPARRWEILTAADWYGADAPTKRLLHTLPARDRPYRDLRDVITALDRAMASHY